MAPASLTYDLSDPDDEREHRCALAGKDAMIALERIDNHLRNILKYGDPTPDQIHLAEAVREMIPAEMLE